MRKARTVRLDVVVWEALKRRSREQGLTITDYIEAVLCRDLGVVPEYGCAGYGDEPEPGSPEPGSPEPEFPETETPEPESPKKEGEAMEERAGGGGLRLLPFILPLA